MTIKVRIPPNFDRAPLPFRLRYFADVLLGMPSPNRMMAADMQEAATEIELGQTTPLTYRGADFA